MNISPLLNQYQVWLDDFTRMSLFHGLCQQQLMQWHRLVITPLKVPKGVTTGIVIPKSLLQITRTGCLESCIDSPKLTKHIDYSLLPGVLISECYRLEKSRLAEQLQMLFRLHLQPGVRQVLTLLCWCELITGKDMGEWYELHLLLPESLQQWSTKKQKSYRGLKALSDEYILATRPL